MQDRARVVIIGGGVHGASLLYHLTLEGWTDVLLIEKAELTSGSTWHAAGQITRSVSDYTTAAFHDYAINLYTHLEDDTGQGISFHQPGGLRVAFNELEMDQLKTHFGSGRYLGYPIELVSPTEAAEYNPLYDFTGALGAIWTEGEGHVDPSGVTMAFANGARDKGATITRRNRVLEVSTLPNGEWQVVTEQGTVTCEHVVDCAGCYGHQVGQMSGFNVPQANVLHHYLVTDEVPELIQMKEETGWEMPVMRDNLVAGYIRQEQTAGLIGIYETRGAESIWDDGVPWDAENPLFPADYDKIAPWLSKAFSRVPTYGEVGIKSVIHGAITHTTDAHMLLGPAPGVKNYWLNTGSSIGLAWGPGAGRELARWIVHGETELNLRHYDPRRFGWADQEFTRLKSIEDYEWMFRVHQPGEEKLANRPVWTSGVYETLTNKRAMHGQAYGWEQPKWFVPEGRPLEDAYGWRRPAWYSAVREECRAVREQVGIMDLSAFTKFEVRGPDARDFLNRLTTGVVPGKTEKTVGKIALNYVLTEQARIETEVTISCLGQDHYYVISGPMGHVRDIDWFRQHTTRPDGIVDDVVITDVTRERGTLVLAGPNSRALLAACTDADVSNDAFGFLTIQELTVCGVPARALRVGFTGSRGWELHLPIDRMQEVYDGLFAADAELRLGLTDFGSHALNSLRMEKAYLTRFELTHDIGPYQAGVGGWVRPDLKDFVGLDRLEDDASPDAWKLAYLHVDVPDVPGAADCLGGETVFHDGRPVGRTTSGGYGFSVDQSLAFAYITASAVAPGTELSVLILGEERPATVLDGPTFDPDNEQLLS